MEAQQKIADSSQKIKENSTEATVAQMKENEIATDKIQIAQQSLENKAKESVQSIMGGAILGSASARHENP